MTPINIINQLFEYIEENRQSPISLNELALISGLSVYQIIRLFNRFTGLSPMAYIRARRLAGSIPQLLKGDSVLSVALDWGFEYEQSYIRAFKESYGITPARFRRQDMPAAITGVPKLGGFMVSANGMLGRPILLARPSFQIEGEEKIYNYQDNLLKGTPLLDGLKNCKTQIYTAACRPSQASHFDHSYFIKKENTSIETEKRQFPAGQWARFEYSGLHGLDESGIQRARLLMLLVIGNWFTGNKIYWDLSFMETVDLCKCAEDYCEITFSCFIGVFEGNPERT